MIDIDINNQIMLGIAAFVVIVLIGNVLFIILKDNKKDKEEIEDLMQANEPKKQPVIEPVKEVKTNVQAITQKKGMKEVESVQEQEAKEEPVLERKEEPILEFNEKKSEIEEMLEKMQQDLEAKTEDIVENFEKEQEEKSIISYQELLKTLKEKENKVVTAAPIIVKEPVKIPTEPDIIEEIVAEPVETIETILDAPEKSIVETKTSPVKEETPAVKKFKNTDFISPIYGKMEDHLEYPKVPVFHPKEQIEFDFNSTIQNNMVEDVIEEFDRKLESHNIDDYLEDFDFNGHMKIDTLEQTLDMPPISPEIKANEEFLQALKEFRKNLE